MRVLVTGSAGFIGKNLCLRLRNTKNVELLTFDVDSDFSVLEDEIGQIDFIFHLAGINRPEKTEEFYAGNTGLTERIVNLLSDMDKRIPVLMSSSIQVALDNDYGKSKKLAEDALLGLCDTNPIYIYRLQNVFGKWCRPNYNSVVATFCSNIIQGLPIEVRDPNYEVNLVYIDDIVDAFVSVMQGNAPKASDGAYFSVSPVYTIALGTLAETIRGFKQNLHSILVPQTGDDFTKKLFATFVSYGQQSDFVFVPKKNVDERGSFTELMHTADSGQVSVSISKNGVVRGNHFHDTKMEKFVVVKGKAKITFRHVVTNEVFEFDVSEEKQEIVTIPVGYTHKIENLSEEMILLIWGNENFDPQRPDTYFDEV